MCRFFGIKNIFVLLASCHDMKKDVKIYLCTLILFLIFPFFSFGKDKDIFFEQLTKKNGLSNNNVYCIMEDCKGFLWVGTSDGLNKYDGNRFKIFRTSDNPNSVSSDCIHYILPSKKPNHVWIGTHNGLDELDLETEKFKRVVNYSPQLSINIMIVDSKGTVWLSNGENGLDRLDYNSTRVIHYLYKSNSSNSLRSNKILAICEDDQQNIWIKQNRPGILKLNKKSGKFTSYFENEIIQTNNLCTITKDKANQLWVRCDNFLYAINTRTIQIRKQSIPWNVSSNNNWDMVEDKDGDLLIGNEHGLLIFNPTTSKQQLINARYLELGSINDNCIQAITESRSKDIVWIGTRLGINKYNSKSSEFKFFSLHNSTDNAIWSVAKDKNKKIWFSTWNNLYYTDNNTNIAVEIKHPNGNLQPRFLTLDDKGNIWMRANNQLCVYSPSTKKFNFFPQIIGVRTLYIDKNNKLWIANKTGIFWYDSIKNCIIPFLLDSTFQERSNLINCLLLDNNAKMWIGSYGKGLRVMDIRTKRSVAYSKEQANSIAADDILSLYQSNDGTIWVGTYSGGINRFNSKNQTFSSIRKKDGLLHESVYGILEDQRGRLWLSSNNGISCVDPKSRKIQNYDYTDGVLCGEFNQSSYFQSQDGEMLFGGLEGFVSFNPEKMSRNKTIPKAILTDFKIFNQSVTIDGKILDKHIAYTPSITLSYNHSMISFDFSVLDYSTPEKYKVAYYLEGFDTKGWNNADNQRSITYTNLAPGDYTLFIKVANSSGVFDQPSVQLEITVTPPFWKTWWAYMSYILMLVALSVYLKRIIIRRTKEEEAIKYERMEKEMKISLFTNISHEFRTPLTLILSPLEHLLQRKSSDNEVTPLLQIMHKNAHTLLNLINQVLDFRKYDAGKMKLQVSKIELVQFVGGIVENFSYLATNEGIHFQLQSSLQQIECWCDIDKLEKIVTNLLSNAFKQTHKGGTISVNINLCEKKSDYSDYKTIGNTPKTAYFEICVDDSGIGMDRNELDNIFEEFYQVKANSQSSGIGLNLSANLVLLHGGQLSVKSEKYKGSQFTIRIPAEREAYSNDEIVLLGEIPQDTTTLNMLEDAESIEIQQVDKNLPLVLIVEDNDDMRTYIKYLLQNDYRIVEAEDGEKGIALACETFPDLIISDVMMPKMTGLELCKTLKTNLETSHIPILLLTALATTEHTIDGLECGADDYITKPFNERILLLCIKRRLETKRKFKELFSRNQPVAIEELAVTKADREFLIKTQDIANKYLHDEYFNVDSFASEMGLSRTLFYKKMKALTNLTPNDFVQNIRLRKAAELLLIGKMNVSEIAYKVGFGTPAHFSLCFKEMYNVNPSQYVKNNRN